MERTFLQGLVPFLVGAVIGVVLGVTVMPYVGREEGVSEAKLSALERENEKLRTQIEELLRTTNRDSGQE